MLFSQQPSGDLTASNEAKKRYKRSMATTMDDLTITMTGVANQTAGASGVDFGESFTFEVVVDFPIIDTEDRSDFFMEFFAIQADIGLRGFHICQAHQTFRGDNVQAIQGHPVYEDVYKPGYPGVIEKTKITYEELHTAGLGDAVDKNLLKFQFQAILLDTGDVPDATELHITAGAEYGGQEYIWVGMADITTQIVPRTYDANINLAPDAPTELKKGDAFLFKVEAAITEPSSEVEFSVFQPLGYNDVFHIGKISVEEGNAFACTVEGLWTESYRSSHSKLSTIKATIKHPFLINRDGVRDVTQDYNKLTFLVPIHAMNTDKIESDSVYDLSFGLKIGASKIWTAIHEITIKEQISAPASTTPTILSVNETNELINDKIPQGNAAVYTVYLTVPAGWVNMNVALTGNLLQGVSAVGARVVDPGAVAYFPPDWAVYDDKGSGNVDINFGDVNNVDGVATTVAIELAYAIDPTAPATTVSFNGGTIGTIDIGTLSFEIEALASIPPVSVSAQEYGWPDNLHLWGQGAFDMVVDVPSGAGEVDVAFEAVPDYDVTAYSARICRVRIVEAGNALPCLHHANPLSKEVYNKTATEKPFDDSGKIEVARLCPLSHVSGSVQSNTFVASLVYELPEQEGVLTAGGTTYKLNGGLKVGDATIWVSNREYTIDTADYTGVNIESQDASGLTQPYFTHYPVLTTRGRTDNFTGLEPFSIQYLLKTQPVTRGHYKVKIMPPAGIKICKFIITHIGDNMPCTEPPGPEVTGFENTVLTYADDVVEDERTCGKGAEYEFKGLTNWGRDPMIADLYPDADSIQFLAFFQFCDTGFDFSETGNNIDYEVTSMGDSNTEVTGYSTLFANAGVLPLSTHAPVNVSIESLVGADNIIYRRAPKLLRARVEVPPGHVGKVELEVISLGYDSEAYFIEMCGIALIEVGENLPCVRIDADVNVTKGAESKEVDGHLVFKSVIATVDNVCHQDFIKDTAENYMAFEFSIRVRDDIDVPQVQIDVRVALGDGPDATTNMAFTVTDPSPGDIPVTPVLASEVDVNMTLVGPISLDTREQAWIPFVVSVPAERTFEMEVSLLLPSTDGHAALHVLDFDFEDSSDGFPSDVLCAHPSVVHLRSVYENVFRQTPAVTTYMQLDSASVDLGYMMNPGFTTRQGLDLPDRNVFYMKALVELADHVSSGNGNTFNVDFAVKFGSTVIATESQEITVNRPSRDGQVPDIIVDANATYTPGTILQKDDTIDFYAVVHHSNESLAETFPGRVRVLTPNYVAYDENSFSTNYTLNHSTELATVYDNSTGNSYSFFDFVFPGGITYPDVFSFEFSVVIDPTSKRLPGSGNADSVIAFGPVCEQNVIDATPAAPAASYCGKMQRFDIITSAPECSVVLNFVNPCQVTASSSRSQSSSTPYESTAQATGSQVWTPAVRSGSDWEEYLTYDFHAAARITGVSIGKPDDSLYRTALRVMIQKSNVPGFFHDVEEIIVPSSASTKVSLVNPLTARYVRLKLLEVDASSTPKPIGVSQVKWYGCFPDSYVQGSFDPANDCPSPDPTVYSDVVSTYRHYAVDHLNDVVYFCDRSPYTSGLFCYSYKDNKWTELPRYIGSIVGFHEGTGKAYFRDLSSQTLLTSRDGVHFGTTAETEGSLTGINAAQVVPGTQAPLVEWGHSTGYKATYDGILLDSTMLLQWKSCCEV